MTLIRKKKYGDDWKYSTTYTLLELDYDISICKNGILKEAGQCKTAH